MPNRHTISKTAGDVQFHWAQFCEYIRCETGVGGPDPHLKFLGKLIDYDDVDYAERLWRIGCYAALYNTSGAQVLWTNWPWEKVAAGHGPTLAQVRQYWKGLPMRKERRPVRSPEKLHAHLESMSAWLAKNEPIVRSASYEELWKLVDEDLYGVGRYIGMRFLEALRLHAGAEARMPDIRPRGGWGSRLTVSFFYPEHDAALNGNDSKANLELANALGFEIQDRLEDEGIVLDQYTVETLLCNYRQAITKGKYPGAPHDTDLEYLAKAKAFWGDRFDVAPTYRARAEMFPHRALGELSGWSGSRKELGETFGRYGYWWSDLKYDYLSTIDLERPERWPDASL